MPFPSVLDSTIVSAFRSCPTKFRLEYVENWKVKAPSVHLHAGAAYAHGLEVARKAYFFEGCSAQDAVALGMAALAAAYGDFECPEDSAKSLPRMMGALEFHFDRYPLETEEAKPRRFSGDIPGIEFSFAEELPFLHPETGDPLIYAGRLDMIADFAGRIWGFDDKTTSSLGASWARQWELRSQFTGYCWAARRNGIPLAGVIVRGISILKTKYDTQQAIADRAEWEVERWYAQLQRDIARMLEAYRTGVWDYNLDHSCAEYGGCAFTRPCKSADPQPWLESAFERRVWNPLTREETLL